ncbi:MULTISPECIES: hypothetical protein [unclassified Rathayibacter]|uniref:hypothetical protein n=1 Tax=unclassified Rathayibacter TaxID=2609250 RepID=UPI0006FC1743|nr:MULTISPECIES: hypothetical protein [unclassified Rathayibacter]KQQ03356.1 hypothetical protein ASF42_07430 [Rathayibacter sp. Leaf294]KQS11811.1 hypothetical protein ASG06_07430 [Rathayibacter sp. Leaf185]
MPAVLRGAARPGALIGLVSAAVIAFLYLVSVVGWGMDGRAPASGWVAIVAAALVGALAGGVAIGTQRALGAPRVLAPLVAPVLVALVAVAAAIVVLPFDPDGSLALTVAVMVPFAVIAVTLATALAAFTDASRWRPIGGVAAVVIALALITGLVAE